MAANIKLGRLWGIPIGLHASWFLVFGLVTWSLATGYFREGYQGMSQPAYWGLAAVTSLLFFGSVLLHELGHSFVALRYGISVRSITLFIFGGVAQIAQEPPTAAAEFQIAIAGPLASLALAVFFGILYVLDQSISYLAAPSFWLMRINLILGLFNLIPGFPLDGGRVLRAAVWGVTGSFHRASQVASLTGQVMAFGFIGLGIFTVLTGSFFDGLWMVFIGWFLQNAAASSYEQTSLRHSLRGVTVAQVMSSECAPVDGHMPLQNLVEERILCGGQRCFLVVEDGSLRGVLSLRDITGVPRAEWSQVTADQVMVPWDRLIRVQPNTDLMDALRAMDDANVAQVPVVDGSRVAGLLSREQILRYVRLRAELGA